jgi:hypothetical protein
MISLVAFWKPRTTYAAPTSSQQSPFPDEVRPHLGRLLSNFNQATPPRDSSSKRERRNSFLPKLPQLILLGSKEANRMHNLLYSPLLGNNYKVRCSKIKLPRFADGRSNIDWAKSCGNYSIDFDPSAASSYDAAVVCMGCATADTLPRPRGIS